MVTRKQLHSCGERCYRKHKHSDCKYGFPFSVHENDKAIFNIRNTRWEYHRPRYIDRNVVPYHATLLLLWGAHLNLQRITSTYWSYYLLKYAMKCEPHGPIHLNKKNAERLGLQGASDAQLLLISSLIIAKPVAPSEAALACLQVPIITKSRIVTYIDSKPPTLRTKIVTSSHVLGFHPMDSYTNRPIEFENFTFTEYFTKYETDRMTRGRTAAVVRNNLGYFVYTNNKITRFTDFHPTYSREGFFFNIVLQNICFRDEKELLSNQNKEQSYVYECHI
jgi:hypothetical protein